MSRLSDRVLALGLKERDFPAILLWSIVALTTAALLWAALARLEAQVAATRLAERLPHIRLSGGDPEWHDSLILRGVKGLPVKLV